MPLRAAMLLPDQRLLPFALNVLLRHAQASRDELSRRQRMAVDDFARGQLESIRAVVASIDKTWLQTRPPLDGIAVDDWPGKRLAHGLIELLANHPEQGASLELFARLAQLLAGAWSREDRRGNPGGSIEIEHEMQNGIAAFVLNLSPDVARSLLTPLLDVTDRHPDKLSQLLTPMLLALEKIPDRLSIIMNPVSMPRVFSGLNQ